MSILNQILNKFKKGINVVSLFDGIANEAQCKLYKYEIVGNIYENDIERDFTRG